MTDKSTLSSNDEQALRAEVVRLNKIVKALIDRAEQDMNAPGTDFNVFQSTIMLEDKVRTRTQELEAALQTNTKITRALQEAKKQIEQSEQRLHDITSALGEGLLVLNEGALIDFINAAACSILGYSEVEVLGKNAHELFHHSNLDHSPHPIQLCKNMKVIQTEQPYVSEDDYFWRKDGTCFPVSVITTPIMLKENTKGIVIAFHDITEKKKFQSLLQEMSYLDGLTEIANRRRSECVRGNETIFF